MDTQRITSQIFKAIELQVLHEIEVNARQALVELGLAWNDDGVVAARRRMEEESPLYVCVIEVHGRVARDMYDDHPGLAYFYLPRCLAFAAPPYCTLSQAKKVGRELLDINEKNSDFDDEFEGKFYPSSVILYSQFNTVVDEYDSHIGADNRSIKSWATELPAITDPVALERGARSCVDEASLEISSDNIESALNLCARAEALHRMIEISMNRDRAIV